MRIGIDSTFRRRDSNFGQQGECACPRFRLGHTEMGQDGLRNLISTRNNGLSDVSGS